MLKNHLEVSETDIFLQGERVILALIFFTCPGQKFSSRHLENVKDVGGVEGSPSLGSGRGRTQHGWPEGLSGKKKRFGSEKCIMHESLISYAAVGGAVGSFYRQWRARFSTHRDKFQRIQNKDDI